MKKILIGILGFFIIGLFLFCIPANASYSDVEYYFINDDLYNGPLPTGTNNFNQRNQTIVSGNFTSSESFDYQMNEGDYYGTFLNNDQIGNNNTNVDFLYAVSSGSYSYVMTSYKSHNSVLNCSYLSGSGNKWWQYFFNSPYISSGTIDLWFYKTDGNTLYLYGNDASFQILWELRITTNVYFYNGSSLIDSGVNGLNLWVHISITFSVATQKYSVRINGNSFSNIDFYQTSTSLNVINFMKGTIGSFYVDAIGYSWDSNYYIGENINSWDIQPLLNAGYVWFDNSQDWNSYVRINDYDGHQNCLNVSDYNSGSNLGISIYKPFTSQTSGYVEYWFLTSDKTQKTELFLGSSVHLYTQTTGLFYWDGASHSITALNNNEWYHLKIYFNCTIHKFNLWVNGMELVINGEFEGLGSSISGWNVRTEWSSSAYNYYNLFDALGFSWDLNYNVGDNRLPIEINPYQSIYVDFINGTILPFSYYDSGSYTDTFQNDSIGYRCYSTTVIPILFWINFSDYIQNGFLDFYATSNDSDTQWLLADNVDTSFYYVLGSSELNIINYPYNGNSDNKTLLLTCVSGVGNSLNISIDFIHYHSGVSESDKIEFTSDSNGNLYALGSNSIEGWDVSETGGNINVQSNEGIDKEMRFTIDSSTSDNIFERDFLDYNASDLIQTEISLRIDGFSYSDGGHRFYVNYTDDAGDLIFQVRINVYHNWYDIWYKNSSAPYGWSIFDENYYSRTGLNSIQFTLGMIFYNNMVFVNYNNSVGLHSNVDYPSSWDSPSEFVMNGNVVKHISFENLWTNPYYTHIYSANISLDYVQFIANGQSVSNETLPANFYLLSNEPLSLLEYNFIKITFNQEADNNVSIYLNDDLHLIDYNQLYLDDYFDNMYQDKSYNGVYLIIDSSADYEITHIEIYGVKTVNSITGYKYMLNLNYGNVNLNNSYFYAYNYDLYFQLNCTNDNLEYIQASFDIPDLATVNRSFYYSIYRSTIGFAQLRLNFTDDTSLWINFKSYTLTQNTVMDYDKIIDSIIILASDNDLWNDQIITGHVDSIEFQYIPNYTFNIISSDLMDVFISLIIIIIPALLFSIKLGKNNVIYLILMMVILTFLFSFIDFFVFFIWIIGLGILILLQKKNQDKAKGEF